MSLSEFRNLYIWFFFNSIEVHKDGPDGYRYDRLPEDQLITEFADNFSCEQLAQNKVFVERLKERLEELKND